MTDTGLAPSKPQTLDDVMIAMDVVDTLRHREDLVGASSTRKAARAS